jgi:hypothetical protein
MELTVAESVSPILSYSLVANNDTTMEEPSTTSAEALRARAKLFLCDVHSSVSNHT